MQSKALTMQENQQAATGAMKKLDEICRELNISYTLTYGTMLGAVRHQGYIPWDDDLDIMLCRPEYDKLVAWCLEHEKELLPFRLFTPENTADYPYMIPRFCDTRYEIHTDNEKDCGMGAFVDIYPLDGIGNTREEAIATLRKRARWSSLYFLSTRLRCERGLTKSALKRLIKLPAFWAAKLIGKKWFGRRLYAIAKNCDFENSKYAGCVIWDTEIENGMFEKAWFDKTQSMPFEQEQFQVITQYDAFLSRLYGDYMQLPPQEDRIAHHFYRIYKKGV